MDIREKLKSSKFAIFVYKQLKYIEYKLNLRKYYSSESHKNIKLLKDKHKGERCFIIGNGPSLTHSDLNRLQNENEITFATNRIYNIFDKTDWRPTYYIVQDFVLLNEIQEKAFKVEAKEKFFPINMKWQYNWSFNDAQYFHINTENYYPNLPKFSSDISKQIYEGYTVTYGALQLAMYLGFKDIYLLGVDFNYSVAINNNGEIIKQNGVKDYFSDDHNLNLNLPNMDNSLLAFKAAKKYADDNFINIFNATRGGKLEVFKRVDFDEIFK